ncbi:MAG TPA: hypothetical protein DFR83_11655, partial [Deltaproteobacteria bacterium]|nr:hypothetical protein [Deltaproteobacteria bacterium]
PAMRSSNPVIEALQLMKACFELKSAWDMDAKGTIESLESWTRAKCGDVKNPSSSSLMVATAIFQKLFQPNAEAYCTSKRGRPPTFAIKAGELIYVQHYLPKRSKDEPETFDSNTLWAIYCWNTPKSAKGCESPRLILASVRTLATTNEGGPGLDSFRWVLFGPRHTSAKARSKTNLGHVDLAPVRAKTNAGDLEVWRLSPAKKRARSRTNLPKASHDRTGAPPYRSVLLRVEAVIDPTVVGKIVAVPWQAGPNRVREKSFAIPTGMNESGSLANEMIREQTEHLGVRRNRRAGRSSLEDDRRTSESEEITSAQAHYANEGPSEETNLLESITYKCEARVNEVLFHQHSKTGGFKTKAAIRSAAADDSAVDGLSLSTTDFKAILVPHWPENSSSPIPRLQKLYGPPKKELAEAWNLTDEQKQALGWT